MPKPSGVLSASGTHWLCGLAASAHLPDAPSACPQHWDDTHRWLVRDGIDRQTVARPSIHTDFWFLTSAGTSPGSGPVSHLSVRLVGSLTTISNNESGGQII